MASGNCCLGGLWGRKQRLSGYPYRIRSLCAIPLHRTPSATPIRKGYLPAWEDTTLGPGALQAHLRNLACTFRCFLRPFPPALVTGHGLLPLPPPLDVAPTADPKEVLPTLSKGQNAGSYKEVVVREKSVLHPAKEPLNGGTACM